MPMSITADTSETPRRSVYSVIFFVPPFPGCRRSRVFLFSSLSAIYDMFTAEQIGCGLGHLYNIKVPKGELYHGSRCTIRREQVFSKRRTAAPVDKTEK